MIVQTGYHSICCLTVIQHVLNYLTHVKLGVLYVFLPHVWTVFPQMHSIIDVLYTRKFSLAKLFANGSGIGTKISPIAQVTFQEVMGG